MCNTYLELEIRKAHTRHDRRPVPAESPYNASRQRQADQPLLGYRTRHEVGTERFHGGRIAHRSVEDVEVFVALLCRSFDDADAFVIKVVRSCAGSDEQTMIGRIIFDFKALG